MIDQDLHGNGSSQSSIICTAYKLFRFPIAAHSQGHVSIQLVDNLVPFTFFVFHRFNHSLTHSLIHRCQEYISVKVVTGVQKVHGCLESHKRVSLFSS